MHPQLILPYRHCTVHINITLELVVLYSHYLQSMGILLNYCILFLHRIIIDYTLNMCISKDLHLKYHVPCNLQ